MATTYQLPSFDEILDELWEELDYYYSLLDFYRAHDNREAIAELYEDIHAVKEEIEEVEAERFDCYSPFENF